MSEIDLLIQELRDTIDNQREEIDRLNKLLDETRLSELHEEYIINELEKWAKSIQLAVYRSNGMPVYQHQDVLDKLKELKEGNKE